MSSRFISLALAYVGGIHAPVALTAGAQEKPEDGAALIDGLIRGTEVKLTGAEYGNQLALHAGENWGFNPSLLIFFFDDEGKLAGKTYDIDPSEKKNFENPHVHYRWEDDAGEIESEIASSDYSMELEFGSIEDGVLPGEIHFSIPGEETEVRGTFRATIKE